MKRLLVVAVALIAAAGISAVVISKGGLGTSSAKAALPGNGLFAYIVPSNPGPVPPCDTSCTAPNYEWNFIHVVNANQLGNVAGFTDRTTWPNAFVIDSVDQTVFVNGVRFGDTATFTPPPNASLLGWSGRWPSTVDCEGQPGSFHTPCDVVLNPAVLPGENTAALYAGWIHGVGEPTGTYVFTYTVHGTLNGAPVDVTASSPAIRMT